jgi:hypothetical protein
MRERREKIIRQKSREDAIMNFVSRQAQEAILDPNLPESYKDAALEAALNAILRIAEKRSDYQSSPRKSRQLEQPQTIYEVK